MKYAVFIHKTCRWLRDANDASKIAIFSNRETAALASILAGVGVSVAELPVDSKEVRDDWQG